jgi:hypothetical protein
MGNIVWTLVVLLVVFWVLGFAAHVGGGLIHALLVLALIVALFNLLSGRSATRV